MTHAVDSHQLTAGEQALPPPPARQRWGRRRLVLTALAVVVFVAALLVLGLDGLIPFGLLLAFSADSDDEEASRSVSLTPRNLGLAAAMVAAFAWFWLWHLDLTESTLVVIAGALIALPLALEESAGDAARESHRRRSRSAASSWPSGGWWSSSTSTTRTGRASTCWRRCVSSCLSCWRRRGHGAPAGGRSSSGCSATRFAGTCGPTCCRASTSGCAALLLGGVLAAGGAHFARIGFSLNGAQFDVVIAAFAAGLVLLAALAVVPRRRVYVATNVVVALLSGFLAVQLVHISMPATDAVVLDSPLAGEWFVLERRPQRPAQRSLPEREQRRRLPCASARTGERTPEEVTPRWPTTPASGCQCWRRPTAGSSR